MLKNNKGVVPAGILFAGNTVGSAFFCMSVVFIAISQIPAVKDDFRAKKANILCEQGYKGMTCADVASMNKEEILAYIKDDLTTSQPVLRERLGG